MPHRAPPLVSVIIPCYNYGRFLAAALDSVRAQNYPATEIVVVDDGSTDDTPAVAARYPEAVYLRQENQGLSAARNAGIRASRGELLVFLDADDWLYPGALATNAAVLRQHPEAAFVAGAHTFVYPDGRTQAIALLRSGTPYHDLLARGNYIAMIAAVMFARWALPEPAFDPALRNCEDYDLYLRLARRHPVVQHGPQLAADRQHTGAMSAAAPALLAGALRVLRREAAGQRGPAERAAYRRGKRFWTNYYARQAYAALLAPAGPATPPANFLRQHAPLLLARYIVRRIYYLLLSPLR